MKKNSILSRLLLSLTTALTLNLTTSAKAASHDAAFTISNDGGSVLANISYDVVDLSDHGDSQITYGTVYLYQSGADGINRLISKTDYQIVPRQVTFNNLPRGDYYVWVNVGGAHEGDVNVAVTVRN